MIPWWWLIVVGLVMFWLGYIVCGLLIAASKETRDPDWPVT